MPGWDWHTGPPMTTTVDRPARPHVLPVQLTSFVGRRAEVDAVRELLARVRLVTLSGPGGAGKTRLAWQVVAELADSVPDGVWWIELAEIADGADVAGVAAAAMGALVEPVRGPLRSLTDHLAARRALVCIDNAEHVLDDVARTWPNRSCAPARV